jgi:multicomponent Na+:H+ antiporter subunit F
MRVVVMIVTALLAVAAVLTVIRIARGPSILDRIIAVDALLVIIIAGVGAEAAYHRTTTTLPLLVVLSMLGFTASTAVARFVGGRDAPRREPQ